jgi:hypothetical protein
LVRMRCVGFAIASDCMARIRSLSGMSVSVLISF